MPTKRRPTLADRRRSAILSQTPPQPAQTAPPAATAPEPPAPPTEENEEKNRRDQTAGAGMDTVSVCLTPETYQQAKAAFLADWHAGGTADTFGDWIAGACLRHAHLTPQQRADHPVTQPSGQPRSFTIGVEARAAIDAALTADATAGYWTTRSAWVLTAIDAAITTAQNRAGGTLPTPPDRLPGRLPARSPR